MNLIKYIFFVNIVLFWSCSNNRNNKINEIINTKDTIRLNIEVSVNLNDNSYTLWYSFINHGTQDIYLPLSYFLIDNSTSKSNHCITEPINTYSLNTIHFTHKCSEISGLIALNSQFELRYMPKLFQIKPQKKAILRIIFYDITDDKGNYFERFNDSIFYTAITRFSFISESKLNAFLKEIDMYGHIDELVENKDTITFDFKNYTRVIKGKGQFTTIAIDSSISEQINLLCNQKIEMISNVGFFNELVLSHKLLKNQIINSTPETRINQGSE